VRTRLVGIDTTSEFGSLALVEDGVVVEELPLHSPDGFGHVLFPQLARLLDRHGWKHETVTGYVAGAGPGSFTGVRVGLAAVKGLAEAAGAKAAAVSNLRAVARYGAGALRAAFFDARRGEIYAGLFDSELRAVSEETVCALPAWLSSLPPDAELITPQAAMFEAALVGRPVTEAPRCLAGVLAILGARELCDPISLDANYVRRSDAELKWKEA
jgi:tRNA threonylcarbamoyladenosine biosynthesis protein TsaB